MKPREPQPKIRFFVGPCEGGQFIGSHVFGIRSERSLAKIIEYVGQLLPIGQSGVSTQAGADEIDDLARAFGVDIGKLFKMRVVRTE